MSHQEILEKAIKEAIAGGWEFFEDCVLLPTKDWIIPGSFTVWNSFLDDKVYIPQQCAIFNHDFAKALWGAEPSEIISFAYHSASGTSKNPLIASGTISIYLHHLQQMITYADPLIYLKENI